MYTVKRLEGSDAPRPARWLGASEGNEGPIYVLERGDEVVWSVGIDFGRASFVPFREELVWESADAIVLGGGDTVYVLDIGTSALRATIAVPSRFGHLALAPVPTPDGGEEFLFVLGWTDVHAVDRRLETRWIARNVAVDGIVFHEIRGDALIVSAEMDPPGGWVEVALDIRTGSELSRRSPSLPGPRSGTVHND
ncbi:hypothetical protein [Polyangium spumosum]|uniref:Uncharacterized protein n=1 Tax=Polyangium spumosum TaxID=889282 RepID=A0A6N7Q246_9BACT|nr:hypothetical protein [Polyangium spumosum]MRG98398.1 hypothetical protein [Polyangium spumosum]